MLLVYMLIMMSCTTIETPLITPSSLSEKSDTPNKGDFRVNSRYDKKI